MARLPLEGCRVIEFGAGYVGPLLCQMLGDFGADVIKIETHYRLDFMRGQKPEQVNVRASFFDVNRNKRSLLLNVKEPEGHELALRLVEQSDVVVDNLAAGTMARLKLDYDTLRVRRPDLIMISLQGLGADEANSTTLGQNIPPFIGMTYLWNHGIAERPVGSQLFHPDYFGGLQGACALMAALDYRRRTGEGQYIDAPQVALAASLLGPTYLQWTLNHEVAEPSGNRSPSAYQGCYRCRGDDRWVVLSIATDDQWQGLVAALDSPAWARDEAYETVAGRRLHAGELDAHLADWTKKLTPAEVTGLLRRHGVPCGPVQNTRDVVADPHLNARGFFRHVSHPVMGDVVATAPAAHLSMTPGGIRRAPPLLGQHTEEVLTEVLHIEPAEIERLREGKVLW